MYYYKVFYSDGTWDILKSDIRLVPKKVCRSCVSVQPISRFKYYWHDVIHKIKYFNK